MDKVSEQPWKLERAQGALGRPTAALVWVCVTVNYQSRDKGPSPSPMSTCKCNVRFICLFGTLVLGPQPAIVTLGSGSGSVGSTLVCKSHNKVPAPSSSASSSIYLNRGCADTTLTCAPSDEVTHPIVHLVSVLRTHLTLLPLPRPRPRPLLKNHHTSKHIAGSCHAMPMPMIRTIPHVPLSLFTEPVSYGNLYHNPVHGYHRRPQYLPYPQTLVYAGQPAPSPKHPLSLDLRRSLGKPQGRKLAVGGDLGLGFHRRGYE
ncbi:uncharacterized protein BDZ83DRAFT_765819 [Colletotrichum acutatum]|uniref:Uncharacterized protein n=1 Tax=Glomerella acutata TaxID=27357 RepID=A0AAD8U7T2_GLOAC|nr:uncharacterized protein BDZ83DRAFT_765819 [Colletotrichum acutatum]KAK1711219.1 hypothetical protein BDZ83DRAFT_765819 [Colletotrichum acutatum]